ncbi:MAG: heavy metal-associated domain-containing protein, partial [Prolixibacteraceae bacterium]|nr:heavy metal-associated domain-containing protein [Prolixibacteraceae bacterium]
MKKMKYNIPFLLMVLFLSMGTTALFAYGNQSKSLQIQKDTFNQSNIVCYEVFGMDCPGCQSALEKQIKKIEGVQEVKANWKKKEVIITVEANKKVSEEAIFERIKKA